MKAGALAFPLILLTGTALARNAPSTVTTGSPSVTIGGAPVARQGDTTADGRTITDGSPDVFINGRPAATAGSGTGCGGMVVGGAGHVFVNGKPLATTGSAASPCPAR